MIKDVHINNPKRSLLRGSNSDTDSAHSRRAPRLRGVLEAVAAGKVREIAFSPKLAIASFIIHYFGWQPRSRFGGHCPRWGRFAQADCRHEMRPMTFLDPGAFVGTNATDEPITSGLPVTRAQLHKAPVHRCGPRHTSSF